MIYEMNIVKVVVIVIMCIGHVVAWCVLCWAIRELIKMRKERCDGV